MKTTYKFIIHVSTSKPKCVVKETVQCFVLKGNFNRFSPVWLWKDRISLID